MPHMLEPEQLDDDLVDLSYERETMSSVQTEQALLGGVLFDGSMAGWFAANVPPGVFTRRSLRTIAAEVLEMARAGMRPDMIALRTRMASKGLLSPDERDLADDLDVIEANSYSAAMVKQHGNIVLGYAAARTLRHRAIQLVKAANADPDLDRLLDMGFKLCRNLPKVGTDTVWTADINIDQLYERHSGIPTPWPTLNTACRNGGWYLGDLNVLMANRGTGKTGALVHSAFVGHRNDAKPAYITLELTSKEITQRMMQFLTGMQHPPSDLTQQGDWNHAQELIRAMNMPIYDPRDQGDYQSAMTVEKVVEWCKDMHEIHGRNMFLIDYGGLLRVKRGNKEKVHDQDHCAHECFQLAKSTGAAVIVATQKSQNVHEKNEWRSALSIMWENNAALVFQIRRKREDQTGKGVVSKNRHGTEPAFDLVFTGAHVRHDEDYDPYAD
jgi:replicative DNA helicase